MLVFVRLTPSRCNPVCIPLGAGWKRREHSTSPISSKQWPPSMRARVLKRTSAVPPLVWERWRLDREGRGEDGTHLSELQWKPLHLVYSLVLHPHLAASSPSLLLTTFLFRRSSCRCSGLSTSAPSAMHVPGPTRCKPKWLRSPHAMTVCVLYWLSEDPYAARGQHAGSGRPGDCTPVCSHKGFLPP